MQLPVLTGLPVLSHIIHVGYPLSKHVGPEVLWIFCFPHMSWDLQNETSWRLDPVDRTLNLFRNIYCFFVHRFLVEISINHLICGFTFGLISSF